MLLTRQDFINYLTNEAKRYLIPINSAFYKHLYIFLKSPEGEEGFHVFTKLPPNKIGIKEAAPFHNIFRRIFDL